MVSSEQDSKAAVEKQSPYSCNQILGSKRHMRRYEKRTLRDALDRFVLSLLIKKTMVR